MNNDAQDPSLFARETTGHRWRQVLAFGCLPEHSCAIRREAERPAPPVARDVIP